MLVNVHMYYILRSVCKFFFTCYFIYLLELKTRFWWKWFLNREIIITTMHICNKKQVYQFSLFSLLAYEPLRGSKAVNDQQVSRKQWIFCLVLYVHFSFKKTECLKVNYADLIHLITIFINEIILLIKQRTFFSKYTVMSLSFEWRIHRCSCDICLFRVGVL